MGVAPQQFLRLPRLPFRHFGGAEDRSRTDDTAIFSRVLYQLSYLGTFEPERSAPSFSLELSGLQTFHSNVLRQGLSTPLVPRRSVCNQDGHMKA